VIRTAIVGVGNCACSLAQAIEADSAEALKSGVSNFSIGKYRVRDIRIVSAFDVDKRKIGIPFNLAIFKFPNVTSLYFEPRELDVLVSVGPLLDGISKHMESTVDIDPQSRTASFQDVVDVLRESKADVVVCYLPVGSDSAAELYAYAAAEAGCAFVNCMPSLIANSPLIVNRFESYGLPLLGDDIKSQVGSTSLHRALLSILTKKGVTVTSSYQLNIGGNSDFKNMRQPERSITKKNSKEAALKSLSGEHNASFGVGPSDYVPHLRDNKVGYINIEGIGLLGMPFSIDLKLTVEDSPNSAGVVINAIRAAMVAKERGIAGIVTDACPSLFKLPPISMEEEEAIEVFNRFSCEETL
jgi:myo-inositol-1-phosphate synthase